MLQISISVHAYFLNATQPVNNKNEGLRVKKKEKCEKLYIPIVIGNSYSTGRRYAAQNARVKRMRLRL